MLGSKVNSLFRNGTQEFALSSEELWAKQLWRRNTPRDGVKLIQIQVFAAFARALSTGL